MKVNIIHYDNRRYLCNHACGITLSKITKNKENVNCKNCLKALKKGLVI